MFFSCWRGFWVNQIQVYLITLMDFYGPFVQICLLNQQTLNRRCPCVGVVLKLRRSVSPLACRARDRSSRGQQGAAAAFGPVRRAELALGAGFPGGSGWLGVTEAAGALQEGRRLPRPPVSREAVQTLPSVLPAAVVSWVAEGRHGPALSALPSSRGGSGGLFHPALLLGMARPRWVPREDPRSFTQHLLLSTYCGQDLVLGLQSERIGRPSSCDGVRLRGLDLTFGEALRPLDRASPAEECRWFPHLSPRLV